MDASGQKVEVKPKTFKIFNGKLFVFCSAWRNNTQNIWNKDEHNFKTKADKNWLKYHR